MVDFELIKGNISRYTLSSIVKSSHDLLVSVENAKDKTYPFWEVLVLIKWAFLFTKDSPFRRKANIKDVQHTMVLIEKYHEATNPVRFKPLIQTGFKVIAYQQFWFQHWINEYAIFRTYYFFNCVESKLDVNALFKSKTGLSTGQFMKSNYLLFLYFFQDRIYKERSFDGVLHPDVSNVLKQIVGDKEFECFIQLISFSPADAENLQKMRYESYQLYETTLWNRFPLLKIQNQYCFIHRSILFSMMRYFIFDYLKKESSDFQTEVGERMEKYITKGISELKVKALNEKELRDKYDLQKVCDFFVDDNILVECKAIGISPVAGIKRTKEILQNEYDLTLIKSYIQLLSTATKINSPIHLYAIIITYRDTFSGFGADAWEEFLKEPVSRFAEDEHIEISLLPPDRIVFITLEDWDRLIQVTLHKKSKISEILDIAFDQYRSGKVLFFDQVLDSVSNKKELPPLTYLESVREFFQIKTV